jgi:hypothetical protein
MKKAVQFVLFGVTALALAGASASADTLTGSCTQVGPQLPDITTSVTCSQFNLTGLQSISLTINGLIAGTITITNNDDTDENVTATVDSSWSLSSPLSGFSFPTPVFDLSFGTGAVVVPALTAEVFPSSGTFSSNNSNTEVDSDNTTFTPYIGSGSFTIPVVSDTSLSLKEGVGCSPCSISSSTSSQLTETVGVVYTYSSPTSAPEPGTLTFLGTGLLFLVVGMRRDRKA